MTVYGTVEDCTAYHNARGNDEAWANVRDTSDALQRGSDYIDQRYRQKLASGRWVSMFSGQRANGRAQDREWPRVNATDYEGFEIPSDEVPDEVIYAAYEAALREGVTPGSLSPDYVLSDQVKSVTVGPVSKTYATPQQVGQGEQTPNRPVVPVIDEIIAPVLVPRYEMPGIRTI